ncbi:UDP-N-acetylmuramate:L-alanyl-gamma-D-glutamyl-meso-diaminopimelate ligase [Castellaniella sp. GW247-6E4]|uniref:UDP-N-acetylmuramate:L-alanyl-gamma-D-glutamyl- meso-diaminopimelate ligase n=1 Tax=Castellaniella sp. GW247-6E4 TaxID=3140380 RepID=UPI003315EEEE
MHIHILGICGTFMGGLALIARSAGHTVTGCDAGVYPPMSTQLREQGIELVEGFDADQLALGADLYIVGNVVTRGNPLMEAILDRGLPYTSGPQWLADHVLAGRHVLAVAGTHGKTTTSSMLAWIFRHAGRPVSFLIGGVAPDLEVSARFDPSASHFVIEADEYDTAFFDKRSKFVHYRPRTAILNNLEYDHADIFPDLHAIETQFHHLVRTVPAGGRIIRPADDPALDRVLARGCWTPVDTFGAHGEWQAHPEGDGAGRCLVRHRNQDIGILDWRLSGTHNQSNALAALAAAQHAGIAPEDGIRALCAFQGVRRRLEHRGEARGVHVYDDFAHHPSAIATTIDGLRRRIGPSARILAVIEPRSNTMKLGAMARRLPDALAQADLVFCHGAAEGKHALGWNPTEVLAPLGARAWSGSDLDALVAAVSAAARPGDHVLVMSNGSFGGIHGKLLDALASGTP